MVASNEPAQQRCLVEIITRPEKPQVRLRLISYSCNSIWLVRKVTQGHLSPAVSKSNVFTGAMKLTNTTVTRQSTELGLVLSECKQWQSSTNSYLSSFICKTIGTTNRISVLDNWRV